VKTKIISKLQKPHFKMSNDNKHNITNFTRRSAIADKPHYKNI